ncbi:LysR family transcriptional regulator [Bradyrhizobium sp. USDA 3256]
MKGWEGIDAFVAVAEVGNFTGAAVRLKVSTSQVSREIRRLEQRLGIRLFVRNTRRVALTECGRLLEQRCRRLIDDRDDAFEVITSGRDPIRGHIRLTCPIAYGERIIVPIVAQFLAAHPEVSAEIELTDRVLDLVADGVDLGIRTGHTEEKRLVGVKLGSRSLHLCAAPAYIERYGAPSAVSEVLGHACLLGTARHWQFRTADQNINLVPEGKWRCNSGSAVLGAALQGLGICQLPDFYVEDHLRAGRLVELLGAERPTDQAIWAVSPRRSRLQSKISALVEFISANLGRGRPSL